MKILPSLTALEWTPDGELHVPFPNTHFLISSIQQCITPATLTEDEITKQIKAKTKEIAELHDWHDSGVLSSPEEIKNVSDAIDDITDEVIVLLTTLSSDTSDV